MEKYLNKGIPSKNVTFLDVVEGKYLGTINIQDKKIDEMLGKTANNILKDLNINFDFLENIPIYELAFFSDYYTKDNNIYLSPYIIKESIEYEFEFKFEHENELKKKLKALSKIKTEIELSAFFPKVYKHYKRYKNFFYLYNSRKLKNNKPINALLVNQDNDLLALKDAKNYFNINNYSADKLLSVRDFLAIFINNINYAYNISLKNICSYLLQHPINIYDMDNITDEQHKKIALYIALKKFSDGLKIDRCMQQNMYYVYNYIKNIKDEDKNIQVDIYNPFTSDYHDYSIKTVSVNNLIENVNEYLIKNPNIKLIDLNYEEIKNMSFEEIEKYTMQCEETYQLSFDILDDIDENMIVNQIAHSVHDLKLSEEEKEEKIREAVKIFIEKKKFYDNLDKEMIIKSNNQFNGYFGFVLKNGTIILDKYFDNYNNNKVAYGSAIYIMNTENFFDLIKNKRSVLRQSNKCIHIDHNNGWQQKVLTNIEELSSKKTDVNKFKLIIKEKHMTV